MKLHFSQILLLCIYRFAQWIPPIAHLISLCIGFWCTNIPCPVLCSKNLNFFIDLSMCSLKQRKYFSSYSTCSPDFSKLLNPKKQWFIRFAENILIYSISICMMKILFPHEERHDKSYSLFMCTNLAPSGVGGRKVFAYLGKLLFKKHTFLEKIFRNSLINRLSCK